MPPLFYLCCLLLKSLTADAPGPYLKLLRKKLQDRKLIVQPVQFTLQHPLIVAFLFLQRLHLEYPTFHNRRTLAAALNEVVALFLIGRDLLFHCQIEFLRHLIPLLGVINDVEAVDHQRRLLFIQAAEQGDEVLENIHALHKSAGDKVHMTGDTQLGGLHSSQEIDADGLDLLAVGASLVEFKKLLRFSAAALHIHRIVQHQIITAEHPVILAAADIRQLFIPVGFAVQFSICIRR